MRVEQSSPTWWGCLLASVPPQKTSACTAIPLAVTRSQRAHNLTLGFRFFPSLFLTTSHVLLWHLNMSSADLLRPFRKPHDDEAHDHIGSNTPPGAATPRPDFVDKRLPGIVNSYFGQVRDSLPFRSKSTANSATPAFVERPSERKDDSGNEQKMAGDSVQNAPATSRSPQSVPTEPSLSVPLSPPKSNHPNRVPYPTPPPSDHSSSSAMNNGRASADDSTASRTSRKRSWHERRKSFASLPSTLRRHTLSHALTSVAKPVVTGFISNPSSIPASPTTALHSFSSQLSDREGRVLTRDAERPQNTPPQTPRSGSYSRGITRGEDVPPIRTGVKSSRSSSGGSQGATIGQLKGQLEICIEEGRGLRPSVEPYVVCIFQLNEDISAGPKEDEMDTRADHAPQEENLAKGVAMKRLGSGSGTPMAIPGLRSRQSSQTNIADLRRGNIKPTTHEITDPSWQHTATFDVVGENNEVDISVYDRSNNEAFIGHVRLPLNLDDFEHQHEDWYKLQPRESESDKVTGEIRLKIAFHASGKKSFGPDDFQILKLIGKSTLR